MPSPKEKYYFYSGTIQELKNGFLVFIDKYDSKMKISYDSIANISEKKRGF